MHTAGEDLPALPGIIAHDHLVRAVHREFYNHRWGAMAAAGEPCVDQTSHVLVQPGHVESAVLHPDVDIVSPGLGVLHTLGVRQDMAGMATDVINRLPRGE